eukprot:3349336-Prymnesium_polylepis.1
MVSTGLGTWQGLRAQSCQTRRALRGGHTGRWRAASRCTVCITRGHGTWSGGRRPGRRSGRGAAAKG